MIFEPGRLREINSMIWPFNKTDTGIDQAASTLNPFIAEALSGLEGQVFHDQTRTRSLTECYIYGAIRYLASYDDMRPASTEGLMQTLLARHFNADSIEVGNSLEYFSGVKDGGREQFFMVEGASALRRWLVNGDRTVASDLKGLLVKDMSN
jgi:hypothetical protein